MQIVSYPPGFSATLLEKIGCLLDKGLVAEGAFFNEKEGSFLPGKRSLPVVSGGGALFSLLAYQKYVHAKKRVVIQSNTMRALYTIPRLLDMQVEVADCSYGDCLAMNPQALEALICGNAQSSDTVVVYSVIGGYLAPSYRTIEDCCRRCGVPLIVDAAHAHYLTQIEQSDYADLAFSFYATKVLPSGEGGLISTIRQETYDWLKRFLIYDRFNNMLEVGLNLRASEMTALFIHSLMTDRSLKDHFVDHRKAVCDDYRHICLDKGIRFLDPERAADYNGYKFIVLDDYETVKRSQTALTGHAATSGVFDTDVYGRATTLPHWCPPTYSSLYHGNTHTA